MNRRAFLAGLAAVTAAPYIVRATSLEYVPRGDNLYHHTRAIWPGRGKITIFSVRPSVSMGQRAMMIGGPRYAVGDDGRRYVFNGNVLYPEGHRALMRVS